MGYCQSVHVHTNSIAISTDGRQTLPSKTVLATKYRNALQYFENRVRFGTSKFLSHVTYFSLDDLSQ